MKAEMLKIYIISIMTLLKEQAREAKKAADNPKEDFKDYNRGSMMAYRSVFSLLKRQAFTFNIDEKALGLTDIDLYLH